MALSSTNAPRIHAESGLPYLDNETFRDAKIVFKNFAGAARQYNEAGDRNFGLLLSKEDADRLATLGWNIKALSPKEEGDDPQPWVKVFVGFNGRPPKIVIVTERNKTPLDEHTAGMVDLAHIKKVDLTVRAAPWKVQGNRGYKAWLQAIFVTIVEDELDREYADIPEVQRKTDEPSIDEWSR